jgi:ribose transport system permease protein
MTATAGPLLAVLLVVALFAAADYFKTGRDSFLTVGNFRNMASQAAPVAVAALGMTLIIIAGGIDLSAGTALALCATVLAWFLRADYSPTVSVLAALATGCATGMLNGVLISLLRVVPFIVTLGTMTIYLGLGKVIAGDVPVRPSLKTQVPEWMQQFASALPRPAWIVEGVFPNFATAVWMTLLLAAALAVVLRYSVFGRHVFAIGSNPATARLCGVNVTAVKIAVYTLAGLFVGIGGLYQFCKLSTGNPTSGTGMELKIIAAVVIGGGSLSGGRGSVLGTLAGAAMTVVITSGCTMLGLSNSVQDIIIGVVIIVAVSLDQWRERRRE